jgi:dihydrofolate reductase
MSRPAPLAACGARPDRVRQPMTSAGSDCLSSRIADKPCAGDHRHVDAILFGSGTYRLLAPYWSQAARDASGTEVTNEFARAFAATPKILFSATAEPWPEWNTTVDRSDPVERVRELRADGEENLVVQASPQLARTLRRAGLIDRLRLLLRPLVAAPGPRCSIRTSTTTTSS